MDGAPENRLSYSVRQIVDAQTMCSALVGELLRKEGLTERQVSRLVMEAYVVNICGLYESLTNRRASDTLRRSILGSMEDTLGQLGTTTTPNVVDEEAASSSSVHGTTFRFD